MRVSISWAFVGNALYAACQWVVFVMLVRSLPLADVGTFAYSVAVTGPIFILANLRLRNVLATDVTSPGEFRDYLTARLLTTTGAIGVSLLAGASMSLDAAAMTVLAFVACAKGCDAVSDICHGLFQRDLDMRTAAIGLSANGLLSVLFVAASLTAWPSLPLAAASYATGSLLTLVVWDLPGVKRHSQRSRNSLRHPLFALGTANAAAGSTPLKAPDSEARGALRGVRVLLWRAAPLGLSSAVGSLQTYLPRYVVGISLGPAALAVFTALAYIPTLGNLVANAIAQAALPVLATDLRGARGAYRAHLRKLAHTGVGLGIAGIVAAALAGRLVLTAIYGRDIAAYDNVLFWLMVAAAMSYAFLFLGTATTARARYGAQLVISAAGLVTVASLVVPLVNRHGLRGAAWALAAGAFVELCGYAVVTLHDFKNDARLAKDVRPVVAGAYPH